MRALALLVAIMISISLLSPGSTMAQSPPAVQSTVPVGEQMTATSYSGVFDELIRLAPLPDRVATVTNFVLERDVARITLDDGQLYLLSPVRGRTVGAVFVGRGVFSFAPPTQVEREQLYRFYDTQSLEEPFTALFLLFADHTLAELERQLIRVSDDAQLWTDRYTANLVPGEIFGVQEQIANQVAEALNVTLLEPERQRLAAQPTDNQEAHDYFLRGNYYRSRAGDAQDMRIAIQMYQKAVELDPDFALAYAQLSYTHSGMWWYFFDRTQERLATAKEAVDKALTLDPNLPEAHGALGWYYYWGYLAYDRALAEFAIAQKSQPNSSDLLIGIGAVQRRQGKMLEALPNFIKASELNPRSADEAIQFALTYILLRNRVEAARHWDRAISLSPDVPWYYPAKARSLHLRLEGNTERARAVLEEARSVGLAEYPTIATTWVLVDMLDGDYQEALDRLASVSSDVLWEDQMEYELKAQASAQLYGLMGNRQRELASYDSARSLLETRIQERPDDERYRSALGIAYAGLGRKEDAIREGELGVELLPMSKDAWRGAWRVEDLARIYTMVGEHDAAIDHLERLLAVPSPTAVPMLRIDPDWNPLRDHPHFQALLAKYEN